MKFVLMLVALLIILFLACPIGPTYAKHSNSSTDTSSSIAP